METCPIRFRKGSHGCPLVVKVSTVNFSQHFRHRHPRQEEEEEEGGSPVFSHRSIALPWKPVQVSTVAIHTTVETYQCDCPKMQIGLPWKHHQSGIRGNHFTFSGVNRATVETGRTWKPVNAIYRDTVETCEMFPRSPFGIPWKPSHGKRAKGRPWKPV